MLYAGFAFSVKDVGKYTDPKLNYAYYKHFDRKLKYWPNF